jgi:hypothetical protein
MVQSGRPTDRKRTETSGLPVSSCAIRASLWVGSSSRPEVYRVYFIMSSVAVANYFRSPKQLEQ